MKRKDNRLPDVLTAPPQATPEWLTEVLHTAGALGRGRVAEVRCVATESASTWALHHLELRYSPDASGTWAASVPPPVRAGAPPARLLLKISHNAPLAPGVAPHHGLSTGKEVWFYRQGNCI